MFPERITGGLKPEKQCKFAWVLIVYLSVCGFLLLFVLGGCLFVWLGFEEFCREAFCVSRSATHFKVQLIYLENVVC